MLETVSTTPTAMRRDREDKRLRDAAAGIPVYLIIDPDDATWHVPELDNGRYTQTGKGVPGQDIPLPAPLGSTVRTAGRHPCLRR